MPVGGTDSNVSHTFLFCHPFCHLRISCSNFVFGNRPLPCRYAAHNAKLLEEAKTALTTGEIRTPSIPSPEPSEGAEGDDKSVEGGPAGTSDDCASSGEVYEGGTSDASNVDTTASSVEYAEEDSEHTCSQSGESSIPTDDTTTEGEFSEYSSSSGEEDNSVSDTSSCGKVNPKVCWSTRNVELVIVYVMLLDFCMCSLSDDKRVSNMKML